MMKIKATSAQVKAVLGKQFGLSDEKAKLTFSKKSRESPGIEENEALKLAQKYLVQYTAGNKQKPASPSRMDYRITDGRLQ